MIRYYEGLVSDTRSAKGRSKIFTGIADALSILAVAPVIAMPWLFYLFPPNSTQAAEAWRGWLLFMCVDIPLFLAGLLWLLGRTSSLGSIRARFLRLPVGAIETAMAVIFFGIPIILMRFL